MRDRLRCEAQGLSSTAFFVSHVQRPPNTDLEISRTYNGLRVEKEDGKQVETYDAHKNLVAHNTAVQKAFGPSGGRKT
jgi:hypothetical protein